MLTIAWQPRGRIRNRAELEINNRAFPKRLEVAQRVLCRLVKVKPAGSEGADTRTHSSVDDFAKDEKALIWASGKAASPNNLAGLPRYAGDCVVNA